MLDCLSVLCSAHFSVMSQKLLITCIQFPKYKSFISHNNAAVPNRQRDRYNNKRRPKKKKKTLILSTYPFSRVSCPGAVKYDLVWLHFLMHATSKMTAMWICALIYCLISRRILILRSYSLWDLYRKKNA